MLAIRYRCMQTNAQDILEYRIIILTVLQKIVTDLFPLSNIVTTTSVIFHITDLDPVKVHL
jgi:hypothetical protein